jgi:hypothetical protein
LSDGNSEPPRAATARYSEGAIKTKDEIQRRAEAVRDVRHSNAMEGLRELPEDAVVIDAYARGEIDGDEARRRIRARIARSLKARTDVARVI